MAKLHLDPYFGKTTLNKSFELGILFTKEIFTPKDLGVSYTNINYWDKMGILSSSRKGKTAWRNFNFIDYVWLRVVDELRELGVPTWLIKEAKDIYFEPVDLDYKEISNYLKKAITENEILSLSTEELKQTYIKELDIKNLEVLFTHFIHLICISIAKKTPVSLILFKDGDCDVWIENQKKEYPKEYSDRKMFETHISISISKIIKDFLLDERSVFLLPQLPLLQPNEIRLLELFHSGSYDEISISFKDKKMKGLKLKKTQDAKRRVMDVLMDGAYQDIKIKSHKGMITHIQNTVKVYLDEK